MNDSGIRLNEDSVSICTPLATIVVWAYKQEDFIEQAIKGAFAQTYTPLEIILSDDNSPDQTGQFMRKWLGMMKDLIELL